jgi:hypothetical protein
MTTIAQFTQSQSNPIKEFAMSALEYAINDGKYEIQVTEINDVVVEYTLIASGGDSVEVTPANPEFQMIHNLLVDSSGLLRVDELDISFYHRDLSRGCLEAYCRAVLLNQFIDNRMELVECAIRTVQNIEARPEGWKGDTRA